MSNNSQIVENKLIYPQKGYISREQRELRNGHCAGLIWLTGLPAAGKSTIARELEKLLFQQNIQVYVLDGDNIRKGLNQDLGFEQSDRLENIRRTSEVARLFLEAGFIVIAALVSPRESFRQIVRDRFSKQEYIEVYVDCPLEICEQRDPKGLYKKARRNEIQNFTGISAPFELPTQSDLTIETHKSTPEQAAHKIFSYIQKKGWLHTANNKAVHTTNA